MQFRSHERPQLPLHSAHFARVVQLNGRYFRQQTELTKKASNDSQHSHGKREEPTATHRRLFWLWNVAENREQVHYILVYLCRWDSRKEAIRNMTHDVYVGDIFHSLFIILSFAWNRDKSIVFVQSCKKRRFQRFYPDQSFEFSRFSRHGSFFHDNFFEERIYQIIYEFKLDFCKFLSVSVSVFIGNKHKEKTTDPIMKWRNTDEVTSAMCQSNPSLTLNPTPALTISVLIYIDEEKRVCFLYAYEHRRSQCSQTWPEFFFHQGKADSYFFQKW